MLITSILSFVLAFAVNSKQAMKVAYITTIKKIDYCIIDTNYVSSHAIDTSKFAIDFYIGNQ